VVNFFYACPNPHFGELAKNSRPIAYHFQAIENGDYKFTIKNNFLFPKMLFGYKLNSELKMTTDDLINITFIIQIRINGVNHLDSYGFDYETGLAVMPLNLLQKFQQIFSYDEILKWFSYSSYRVEIAKCLEDSVSMRFYIPLAYKGCHFYVVGKGNSNENTIWVSEILVNGKPEKRQTL